METKLTVKLPLDLRQRAKIMAAARGVTISEIVRGALEQFIVEAEENGSEDVQAAITAYERYKADPSKARPYSQIRAELVAEGRLSA
jgi:predicted DNA-binding protein